MEGKLTNKQIQHLYWRAGFGISYRQLKQEELKSKIEIVEDLFKASESNKYFDIDLSAIGRFSKKMSQEEKKALVMMRNKKTLELNSKWIEKMETTKGVLRERMTLFFQNHFATRIQKPTLMYKYHKIINKNALGNFGEMLMEVSKSAAMLQFLNNRQNRKQSPNENFAREVMELFTLGRDNGYTQNDIKEAARAFTGWDFDAEGDFSFMKRRHDFEQKKIFGKVGNFTGDDVIQMLLEKKETAVYLTQKIYKYLVNSKLEASHVKELSEKFYNSNYDIKTLLKAIFTSNWFYEEKNIGVKIKSPIDLIVGINRQFNIKYENRDKTLLFLQRKLNQVLFQPPNVAGWPGDKHWIDSSTLMVRLKIPSLLMFNEKTEIINLNEQSNKISRGNYLEKRTQTTLNWKKYLRLVNHADQEELKEFLIQPKLSEGALQSMKKTHTKPIQNQIVALLSLPEYQLC